MKQFSILDIRGPWASAGRSKRRTDADCAAAVDACRLPGSVLPANAANPCGFISQTY